MDQVKPSKEVIINSLQSDQKRAIELIRSGQYGAAFPLLESMIKHHNNRWAEWQLGYMYERGRGVPKDCSVALKYYQAAADQGFTTGLFNAGSLYMKGLGTSQDYQKAMNCFTAAKGKDDDCLMMEGVLYCLGLVGEKPDYTKAIHCFQTLADKNVAASWWKLGVMFLRGFGVTSNKGEAQRCFSNAIECGLPEGAKSTQEYQQYRLRIAVEYLEQQAYSAAFIHLLSLSHEGMKEAQDQLVQLCLDGHLTDDNLSCVIRIFKEMHEKGEPDAAFRVGQLIMKLPLVSGFSFTSLFATPPHRSEENIKEALRWFQTAADEANGTDQGAAYYQMAMLLHEENTDLHKIPVCLEKAYLQGHPTAEEKLYKLRIHYSMIDRDIANALADATNRIRQEMGEQILKINLESRMKTQFEEQTMVNMEFNSAMLKLEAYTNGTQSSDTEEDLFNTARYFLDCDRPDYALTLLEPLANNQHAKAQFLLGQMHRDGLGVAEINLDKAMSYFKNAYNNSYDEAGLCLVDFYLKHASSEHHPNVTLAKEIVEKMLSDQLAHLQPPKRDKVAALFTSKPTVHYSTDDWYEYSPYLKAALNMAKIHYLEKTSSREDLSSLAQEIILAADKNTQLRLIEWYLTRSECQDDREDAKRWLQELNVTAVPDAYLQTLP